MDQLEKVEKIREKTGVTYEEAREALQQSNDDLLDAVVYLERQGKIKKPELEVFSTQTYSSDDFKKAADTYEKETHSSFGEIVDRFFAWCGDVLKKSWENYFDVKKEGKVIISAPILILVLLLIFAFPVSLILLIVGMFFGFRYSFRGNMNVKIDLNEACDKAADACDQIKKDVKGKKDNQEM